MPYCAQPYRDDVAVYMLLIIVADVGGLFLIGLSIGDDADIVLRKGLVDLLYRHLKILGIPAVEPVDLLDRHGRRPGLAQPGLPLPLGHPVQGGYADAEKLIQIIGVNPQEIQPLKERNFLFTSLLQHTPIEVHPADVPLEIRLHCLFLSHN